MSYVETLVNARTEIHLRPLERVIGTTPVLTAGVVAVAAGVATVAGVAFATGNAVTDYVGDQHAPQLGGLASDSPSTELLFARHAALRA